ncbi:MAG: hypothetical protein KDE27_01760 [Planctomycetes bacterium]|nr:hypothetical protein [Planctomycetota bacterium]
MSRLSLSLSKPCVALLAAAAALGGLRAQLPYGHGNPGSSGAVPRLTADQGHIGNLAHAYALDRGRPLAAAALLVGLEPAAASVFGVPVWIGLQPGQFLLALPLTLDGSGAGQVANPLGPTAQSLVGLRLYLQAAVIDQQGGVPFLAVSNGLVDEIVDRPLLAVGGEIGATVSDPLTLLDPRTLAIVHQSTPPNADGLSGAVFAAGGTRLYAASASRSSIEAADTTVIPPSWSTFANLTAPALGIAYDPRRRLLYTVSGNQSQAKDLVVFDADPQSPGYGTELDRAVAITTLDTARQWQLAPAGDRIAIYSGTAANELMIVDVDPAGTGYLQVIDRAVVPGLQPPLNALSRVRVAADASMAYALLSVGFFTVPSGLHRYDVRTGQWRDHNALAPGIQAIGPSSSPPGPMVTSSDLAFARDESFAVLTEYAGIRRIDLDRDDPAAWNITAIPGSWTPNTSFGHTVTATGDVLLFASGPTATDSVATLVDPFSGQVRASAQLIGVFSRGVLAER